MEIFLVFIWIVVSVIGIILAWTWTFLPFKLLAAMARQEMLLRQIHETLQAIELTEMTKSAPPDKQDQATGLWWDPHLVMEWFIDGSGHEGDKIGKEKPAVHAPNPAKWKPMKRWLCISGKRRWHRRNDSAHRLGG